MTDDSSVSSYYLGVDVGTSSARAAIVDAHGRILAAHVSPLDTNTPQPDYFEQSSQNIWQACCSAVQRAVHQANIDPTAIKGLGFDATCSLVALSTSLAPVTVSPTKLPKWNVIMWMDHRASAEAAEMSAIGHTTVLQRTGGKISAEMSAAKTLWLARHMPESYAQAETLIELPDFLTLKATGRAARGLNSLACKWTYDVEDGFDDAFWRAVGMDALVDDGYAKFLGKDKAVVGVGEVVELLTEEAAREMGIPACAGLKVGAGIIDAYAGAIGTLGASLTPTAPLIIDSVATRMAVICGTSSCHIALSRTQHFIPGIWGPYNSILLPTFHVHEGGQSLTGALLDHIIKTHPAFPLLNTQDPYAHLNTLVADLARDKSKYAFPAQLTRDLHLTPDFHGNRSPVADAALRGVIVGASLDVSVPALATLYLATVQALCYGARQIINAANAGGHVIGELVVSGGLCKNALFVKTLADATRCRVLLPREADAVLLGAAMLGATAASGGAEALWDTMVQMGAVGTVVEPCRGEEAQFHQRKYEVFEELYRMQAFAKDRMVI
ncbi:putative carbohydrate kinase [Geranomyces variabilis]|nr:putative carbohydrate kinase [Geranomyces variabilis]